LIRGEHGNAVTIRSAIRIVKDNCICH